MSSSDNRLRTEFAKHLAQLLTATLILWPAAALISGVFAITWCAPGLGFIQILLVVLPVWAVFPFIERAARQGDADNCSHAAPGLNRSDCRRLLIIFFFFGAFLFWTGVRNCRKILRLLRITPTRIAEAVETLQAADGQPLSVPKLAAIHDMTPEDLLFAFEELKLGTPLFRNTEIALKDQWRLRQTPGETPK